MTIQQELSLIVPVSGTKISVRFDQLERMGLDRLRDLTGLPLNDLVRRCVAIAYHEKQSTGSYEFLVPITGITRRRPNHMGPKTRRQKRSLLEASISRSLRELDRDRAALAQLEAEKVRAA
jgi:hypothetical protein